MERKEERSARKCCKEHQGLLFPAAGDLIRDDRCQCLAPRFQEIGNRRREKGTPESIPCVYVIIIIYQEGEKVERESVLMYYMTVLL